MNISYIVKTKTGEIVDRSFYLDADGVRKVKLYNSFLDDYESAVRNDDTRKIDLISSDLDYLRGELAATYKISDGQLIKAITVLTEEK